MVDVLEKVVAGAREALGSEGVPIGVAGGGTARYELFNGANSICSQKVRSVLAFHRMPYINHNMNMFLGQTYLPGYVRMRMIGCEHMGGALVSHHSGSTSASAGCDGAVVPTLIDWQANDVIVDSKRICLYLDDQAADGDKLRPAHLAKAIDAQMEIVDNIPNYQMLMGRKPSDSESETTKSGTGGAFSEKKVAWCDHYLAEYPDEPALVAAYRAKRAKELSAVNELFSPEAMQVAYDRVETSLKGLEADLAASDGAWLFGDRFTMADLFWGIELLRLENMGVASFWEEGRLPHVARYCSVMSDVPAIRTAIIEWTGATF